MRRAFGPILGVALVLSGLPAAATEPPPALIEATEQAAAQCRELGGDPEILASYELVQDLNGDGRDDFVTDLANLQCTNAWSAFCGSAGCPVSVWLSEPGDGYTRFDFGYLIGFDLLPGQGDLPRIVAHYHGTRCDDDRVGAEHCTRTWRFTSNAPEEPPVDATPEPQAAEPPPQRVALSGWTLRRVPGASPVALGAGIGNIASLAAFCLQGQPFLAISFLQRPAGDSVALAFAFSQGPVNASAGFEPTAGGAFVTTLADGPLAARLGGRDSEVKVSVDGTDQGMLSLAGSTKALRGALEDCPAP